MQTNHNVPTTINAHGDIAPEDVLIVISTYYRQRFYVSRRQYETGRTLLTRYNRRGQLLGRFNRRQRTFTHATPLHRENIATVLPA